MSGYGATYESSLSNYNEYKQSACLPGWKGSAVFVQEQRRRINLVAIIYSVLLPWAIFAAVFYAMTSTLRFKQPAVAYAVVAICALPVAGLLASAADSQRKKRGGEGLREPNWLMFLFLTALLAFVAAVIGGDVNYRYNLQPYLDVHNLATYANVDTRVTRGQQVMDGGLITFAPGTILGYHLSMGFKSQRVYCVSPITTGNTTLSSYDFWAVGTDCCSGGAADFHCNTFNKGSAGGLRLLRDEERPYYRLAVQQAEATYGIKAVHPIFFDFERDPVAVVNSWQDQAFSYLLMGMVSYLCVQMFFVAVASVAFAKLGSQGRL